MYLPDRIFKSEFFILKLPFSLIKTDVLNIFFVNKAIKAILTSFTRVLYQFIYRSELGLP